MERKEIRRTCRGSLPGSSQTGFRDIAADPECLGSQARLELAKGVRAYHLRHSRDRTPSPLGIVREPRHFVIYRQRDRIIDIVRVLHDARDLARHLP